MKCPYAQGGSQVPTLLVGCRLEPAGSAGVDLRFIRLKRAQTEAVVQNAALPRDFWRHWTYASKNPGPKARAPISRMNQKTFPRDLRHGRSSGCEMACATRLRMTRATAVGLATGPRVVDPARQPREGDVTHVAGAAANDRDPVACQEIHGSAPHIPRQHHRNTPLSQFGDDARLASAAGRRSQCLFRDDLVLGIHFKNREALAVAKMSIDLPAIGR